MGYIGGNHDNGKLKSSSSLLQKNAIKNAQF